MLRILFTFLIFFFVFFPLRDSQAKTLDVIINEIAWMGTKDSYRNEWIELYNNRDFDINLENWKIISKDKRLNISLKGVIPKNGFFVLERNNDTTIPEIKADLIYNGALNNKGEHLILLDSEGRIIDEVNCSSGWFAGDNSTKQTMERKNPFKKGSDPQNWQSSKKPQGTPKSKNSYLEIITKEQKQNQSPLKYPSNIFINEILPSPEGPDYKNEWIEIFNKNDFEVNLEGWKISDRIGRTTTYILPKNTTIKEKSFLLLRRPATKITLNNSKDTIFLYQPDGRIVDQVTYTNAPRGHSFARIKDKWFWTSNPTPKKPNNFSSFPISTKKESLLGTKISSGDLINKTSKTITHISLNSSSFLSTLTIALGFAFSCGVFFVCLKRKLKKNLI